MRNEYWLDGFNIFHKWQKTKGLFADKHYNVDLPRVVEQSIRILSRDLAQHRAKSLIFIDGGVIRTERHQAGIRVRYAGPGKKADDRMVEDLGLLGSDAGKVTAVSDDRELRSRLSYLGASSLGVMEFLSLLAGPKGGGKGGKTPEDDLPEVMRIKCRPVPPSEVKVWLEIFAQADLNDADG